MKMIPINGARVKSLRQAAGLTQSELSDYLPITKQAISQIECKGIDARVRPDTLKYLAKILHCTEDYLKGKTNYFNQSQNSNGIWFTVESFEDALVYSSKKSANERISEEKCIVISAIMNTLKGLSLDHLNFINSFCTMVAESDIFKDDQKCN